ncbi:MAG: hypothetical protein L0Y50_03325 [Beijerinckiaceae bacterium]|nr:hypothetical protein [Beijerinckiaceae bacterium]MCI0735296.1 hypothetical protein [Beijerinckiaceae bacterium]
MSRRNLVVVRAGDKSLHPHWLSGEGCRNWDLVVSYFGDDPGIYRQDDVERIDAKGPKWHGLYELFSQHPGLVKNYDYILLPDDDLMASKPDINRLFDLCGAYGLEVGHPALTWNSYYSHLISLRNCATLLRYTNFVETMSPCLSAAILEETRDYFGKTLSGWGLERVWAKLAGNLRMAIIDEVTVRHTRPVGGPNYKILREKGISPWDELRAICCALGEDERPVIETYAAVLRDKNRIDRAPIDRVFDFHMLRGWIWALRETPSRKMLARRIAGYTYKTLRQRPDRVVERAGGAA